MSSRPALRSTAGRLVWLVACLAAGGGVGAIGHALTGDAAWVLAVPAVLAVGWWFVADPGRCSDSATPQREDRARPR